MRCRISKPRSGAQFFGLLAVAAIFGMAGHSLHAQDAIAQSWRDLGDEDAVRAYRAVGQLAQDPDEAGKWLAEHMKVVEAPDFAQINAFLKDLSSGTFA